MGARDFPRNEAAPPGPLEARRRRLLSLVGESGRDVGADSGDDLPGQLARVCRVAVSEVGVSGAGVTVMSGVEAGRAGHRDQVCATGRLSGLLEDLQLTTGEGPCLDAYDGRAPVLAGDLASEPARWIGFGPEALAAGAAAVFSLPLQIGAVRLGTLDLYRETRGPLGRDEFADALVLAGLATEMLLGGSPDRSSQTGGWLPDVHAEVHQASGMVSVQEGVGVVEALQRIRAHAFARSIPIDQVARRILDRDLVLDDDQFRTDEGPTAPGTGRKS